MIEEKLTVLALVSIEKGMISRIHNFNGIIINLLASKKPRTGMDFTYHGFSIQY